jgi:hypothetical protein
MDLVGFGGRFHESPFFREHRGGPKITRDFVRSTVRVLADRIRSALEWTR